MKLAAFTLCATLFVATDGFAQGERPLVQRQFEGPTAQEAICSFLLDARQQAEVQGRVDFVAKVEAVGASASPAFIARISSGPAYAIRRIGFSGNRRINDTTLRRMLIALERDMLNVRRLRDSLAQIDKLGVFEPLTMNDVIIDRLDDGVSIDLTIQLRERKPRWWTISGMLLPGNNPWKASIASRLPAWGRGVFEMATYFVSLNAAGLGIPFFALERPLIPGQAWLSGFAITPSLSPRAAAMHYTQSHALLAASTVLNRDSDAALAVDFEAPSPGTMVCKAPKPRFWWLRLAARQVIAIYS